MSGRWLEFLNKDSGKDALPAGGVPFDDAKTPPSKCGLKICRFVRSGVWFGIAIPVARIHFPRLLSPVGSAKDLVAVQAVKFAQSVSRIHKIPFRFFAGFQADPMNSGARHYRVF